MAAANNNDILTCNARLRVEGSICENLFAFKFTLGSGSGSTSEVGTIMRAIMAGIYGQLVPYMQNTVTFVDLIVKNLSTGLDIGTFAWDTSTFAAGSNQALMPPYVAPVCTFPTARAKTRARKFWPGFTVQALAFDSTVNSAALVAIAQACVDLLVIYSAGGTGSSLTYVVVSQGVGAFTTYQPVSLEISNIYGHQTRRKQGVGI